MHFSGADIAAILVALTALIPAIANSWLTLRTGQKVDGVRGTLNGHDQKLDELITAHANGVAPSSAPTERGASGQV